MDLFNGQLSLSSFAATLFITGLITGIEMERMELDPTSLEPKTQEGK